MMSRTSTWRSTIRLRAAAIRFLSAGFSATALRTEATRRPRSAAASPQHVADHPDGPHSAGRPEQVVDDGGPARQRQVGIAEDPAQRTVGVDEARHREQLFLDLVHCALRGKLGQHALHVTADPLAHGTTRRRRLHGRCRARHRAPAVDFGQFDEERDARREFGGALDPCRERDERGGLGRRLAGKEVGRDRRPRRGGVRLVGEHEAQSLRGGKGAGEPDEIAARLLEPARRLGRLEDRGGVAAHELARD
jgi:hypothetical protein